jgi:RHS repeat-associated protein
VCHLGIALRVDEAITWLLSDHLSSTTVTVDATGNAISMLKYTAYGELRTGTSTTDYQYTSQRNESEIGLYYYIARFYDPVIGHFIQPDSVIPNPNNPLDWNRYAYARYDPIKFSDPNGHWVETALDIAFIAYDIYDIKANGLTWISGLSLAADVAGAIIPVATGLGVGVRAIVKAANAVDNAGDLARVVNSADNLVDTGKTIDTFVSAQKPVDKLIDSSKLPLENHHFATNKNKVFTPKFEAIVEKYGLDLNGSWNIDTIPHQGRHPNDYHNWVLDEMNNIEQVLEDCGKGSSDEFIKLFTEKVITPVIKNPSIIKKSFWIE